MGCNFFGLDSKSLSRIDVHTTLPNYSYIPTYQHEMNTPFFLVTMIDSQCILVTDHAHDGHHLAVLRVWGKVSYNLKTHTQYLFFVRAPIAAQARLSSA